jgi:SAM-dependent methyltransferase
MSGERSRLFDKILDLIEERKSSDTLLDVGTGCGFFLMAAKKRGWKVRGIEPSIQSVEIASRESGLDIYSGTFQEYDKKVEFDVITFINVLDHSMEPWKDVERAINLLKSGGIIYFRFPNGLWHTQIYRLISKLGLASLIRKFLVFHEVCFSPKFIKRLLSDFGFTDVVVYNAGLSGGSLIRLSPFFSFAVQWIEILEKVTDTISGGRFLWGPSLEVIATKK